MQPRVDGPSARTPDSAFRSSYDNEDQLGSIPVADSLVPFSKSQRHWRVVSVKAQASYQATAFVVPIWHAVPHRPLARFPYQNVSLAAICPIRGVGPRNVPVVVI
jgi:hypothetical protein